MAREHRRVLFLGGCGVTLGVVAPAWLHQRLHPGEGATDADLGRWMLVGLAYLLALAPSLHPAVTAWELRVLRVLQSAAVLALMYLPPCFGLEGALLVVIALELGLGEGALLGLTWIGIQSVAMFIILAKHWAVEPSLVVTGAYLPFQILARQLAALLARETATRRELLLLNAELFATRELAIDKTRSDERHRISRDLHDVLGHRLVALGLQLELAARTGPDESAAFLGRAQALAGVLLEDVRAAVHGMTGEVDVVKAFRALAAETPVPEVRFVAPEGFEIRDRRVAETLLRCGEELVTNAVKHAGARHVDLCLARIGSRIELTAKDDGHGAVEPAPWSGLAGMEVRLKGVHGGLEVHSGTGRGFRVTVWTPAEP
jgi:signal transduction histidine kinase